MKQIGFYDVKKIRTMLLALLFLSICLSVFGQSISETKELGYIFFAPDMAIFENEIEAKSLLDRYAKSINSISSNEKQIHINGWTAIFDNDIDPIKLSTDRAKVILNELKLRGISEERFDVAKGNGGTSIFGNNSVMEERKLNRRVTISIDEYKEVPPVVSNVNPTEEPKVENNLANNVKQDKPVSKINWKKILLVVAIIVAIVAIILLVKFVIIPAIGTAGVTKAGAGATVFANILKKVKDGLEKIKKVFEKSSRVRKTGTRVVNESVRTGKKIAHKIKETIYRGGRYGDLENIPGTERHHMPPWNSFPPEIKNMKYNELPAIRMDINDHVRTLGHSGKGKALDEACELLRKGKFNKVVKRYVEDVKKLFPDGKYDQAIKEYLLEAKKYQKIFKQKLKGI